MATAGPMSCPKHTSSKLQQKTLERPYICDGCKMDGVGPRFTCRYCDYDLHPECMNPLQTLTPLFLQQGHTFKFLPCPAPGSLGCSKPKCKDCTRHCDACGTAVRGFSYHCQNTGFDLHPRCALLKNEFTIDGMKFRLNKETEPRKCDCCNSERVEGTVSNIPGWSYVSVSGDEEYNCHVSCIMDMAVQSWGKDGCCDCGLALEKWKLPPMVKKKRRGVNGNKYWKMLKAVVTVVLSLVFGDPTMVLAKLAVEGMSLLLS